MVSLRVVVAALAVCVALFTAGGSNAADKIVLVCSGSSSIPGAKSPMERAKAPMKHTMTLIIDRDEGSVTNSWVGFQQSSITGITDGTINFEGAKTEFGTWKGAIDRYSGSAWIDAQMAGLTQVYELTCKPAKPLF
jgi:hypothetical protein